jgi:hypothetical protein
MEHEHTLKDLAAITHRNFLAWVEVILERMSSLSKNNVPNYHWLNI